jgi:hypothetical protein
MPDDRYQVALGKLGARLRQKSSIYLALSLIARVLNAFGMFVAIQRFVPSSFGEMSYLQATAVAVVAFCSFGIEISINAQLTRKLRDSVPIGPTVVAGTALALAGAVLACLVICGIFAPQLKLSMSPGLAILSAGVDLMFFFSCAQLAAVPYMALALLRHRVALRPRNAVHYLRRSLPAIKTETSTLFAYGAKQILVVCAVTFSQWLIQRKIVFGDGGTSENAIYSIGNQIFNMMTFIPLIITPLVITRLAAAGTDVALRRAICLRSLRLFTAIALCACAAVFVGLRLGVPFLPPRYSVAVETGLIAAGAAAFQIVKSPFSLFFLSELKASREIASATAGAVFMIVATSMFTQLSPNEGTLIRLLGCALQATFLGALFLIETRTRSGAAAQSLSP